jgi:predicted MFS family arabinose efflux permease
MGNLNFAHNAGFSWYCILLMVSGIAMLLMAVLRNQIPRRRIIRAIFGVGFFLYGFYLTFVFSGGHYFVFFQAFIVPVLLLIDTLRGQAARRRVRQPAGGGNLAG